MLCRERTPLPGVMRIAPSRRIISPLSIVVLDDLLGERAYSSGGPGAAGTAPARRAIARRPRGMPASIGVSKMPGAIVTTRMPSSRELAGDRQRHARRRRPWMRVYAAWPIWPSKAATDAVLMITPRSPSAFGAFLAIASAASRSALKVPIRLILMTRLNVSSLCGPFLPTTRSPVRRPRN